MPRSLIDSGQTRASTTWYEQVRVEDQLLQVRSAWCVSEIRRFRVNPSYSELMGVKKRRTEARSQRAEGWRSELKILSGCGCSALITVNCGCLRLKNKVAGVKELKVTNEAKGLKRGLVQGQRIKKDKKTGLVSQGMTKKPGEFSNLVQQ